MNIKSKTLIRKYNVIGELGSGRWGSVYKVQNKNTGQLLALKGVLTDTGRESESLAHEFRMLSHLDHPNIVKVYDLEFFDDGSPFYTMEYIEGSSIRSYFEPLRKNPAQMKAIVKQICNALSYIHNNGIVHLDLKPENILISRSGGDMTAKISDFGLAELFKNSAITEVGVPLLKGTYPYMSPEGISGRKIDHRSDLYSMGVILYEWLTGTNPFALNSVPAIISAHIHKHPTQPSELNSDIDPVFNSLVLQLLAKEPSFRPGSADEIAVALQVADHKILTPPPITSGMFVGQHLPWKELSNAFETTCQGHGTIVLVQGPEGIGKSRLLEDIKADFQLSGAHVIDLKAEPDIESSYDLFKNLFRRLHEIKPNITEEFADAIFGFDAKQHLYQNADRDMIRNMHQRVAKSMLNELKTSEDSQWDAPLVIVLRDFHTDEQMPWLFLKELAIRWEEQMPIHVPCLFLIETRSEMGQSMIHSSTHGRLFQVDLVPLTEDETNILLGSLLSVTPFPQYLAQKIHEISEGNPLQINIIAQTLHQNNVVEWKDIAWRVNQSKADELELAANLTRLFKGRISQLSLSMASLLTHAALWPRPFEVRELLLTLPDNLNLSVLLQNAILDGFITKSYRNGKTVYAIQHAILRDQLHNSIPAYIRIEYHLAISKYLLNQPEAEPVDIAYHLLSGDNRLDGCEWAIKTARQFADEGKYKMAVKWYEAAIENMPDRNRSKIAQISYDMAQNLYLSNEFQKAITALVQAEPILESRFYQKREKAKYLMLTGACFMRLGDYESAARKYEEALAYLPKTTALEIRLNLLAFYTHTLTRIGRKREAIELATETLQELPLEENPYFAGLLLSSLAYAYLHMGQLTESESAQKEAIRYGEMLGNPVAIVDRYIMLGQIYQYMGRHKDALQEYEKVIQLARKNGDPAYLASSLCLYAALKIRMDMPGDADELLQEALDIAERIGRTDLIVSSLSSQSILLISQGKLDRATELLTKATMYVGEIHDYNTIYEIYKSQATIALRRGNWSLAIKHYDKFLRNARKNRQFVNIGFAYLFMANTFKHMQNWARAAILLKRTRKLLDYANYSLPECDILEAEISLGTSDIRKALVLAKKGLSDATERSLLHAQGDAHRVLGQIYHKQGNFDKARKHFGEAIASFETRQKIFELGVSHYNLGELYQTLADIEKAGVELNKAKEIFTHLSAEHYLSIVNRSMEMLKRSTDSSKTEQIDPVLSTFEELTSLINSITDTEKLLELILDVAIRFVHAERGLIILNDPETGEPEVKAIRNLDESTSKDASFLSKTILQETTSKDTGVFSGDAPSDPRFSTIKSVREYNILSLICEPLRIKGKAIGVIYVDSRRVINLFSEKDRRFLRAFANLAAVSIERSQFYRQQEEEKEFLQQEIQEKYRFGNIIGKSRMMQQLFQQLMCISRTDTAVLITGSSGVGKDLVTHAIHYNSSRKKKKLVAVNCAAIPENLVESELFGYAKGAFTDAKTDKPGRFEFADGGTLFLDEVGELPLRIQAKLLRAIENKEITRLGEDKTRQINVRIIAATNRDLRAAIQNGSFREDFYFRLRVAQIRVPDLKERMDDIPLLSKYFLQKAAERTGRGFTEFSPKAIEALIHHTWPGNVRELEHAIESAVVFGMPPTINLKDLPQDIRIPFAKSGAAFSKPDLRTMDEVEEAHIRSILAGTGGNKLRACQILNISRPTLDRKLERFSIKVKKNKRK